MTVYMCARCESEIESQNRRLYCDECRPLVHIELRRQAKQRARDRERGENPPCRDCREAFTPPTGPGRKPVRCPDCRAQRWAQQEASRPDRPCGWCKEQFEPSRSNQVYCSDSCRGSASIRRSTIRQYGLSLDDFDRLLADQDGRCAVCGEPQTEWHVDHCHDTGRVRGLLCPPCNKGLGYYGDDPGTLLSAALYVSGGKLAP